MAVSYKPWKDGEPCSHPGCLSHISHPCEDCGRIGGKYPMDIIADLRTKLVEWEEIAIMERARRKEASRKIVDLQTKLEAEEKKRKFLAEDCIRLYKERDNLQTAYGVLRGAMEFYANTDNYGPDIANVVGVKHDGTMEWGNPEIIEDCGERAQKALSTTPAETGERVQKLMDAAMAVEEDARIGCGIYPKLLVEYTLIEKLKDALARYRGEIAVGERGVNSD